MIGSREPVLIARWRSYLAQRRLDATAGVDAMPTHPREDVRSIGKARDVDESSAMNKMATLGAMPVAADHR